MKVIEDYVSFETRDLLNKVGFECRQLYAEAENFETKFFELRPTQAVVMKWLRETHNIQLIVTPYNAINKTWTYSISKDFSGLTQEFFSFDTYEQACEAGIKYCLEKLIEP